MRLAHKERQTIGDADGLLLRGLMPRWLVALIGFAGSVLGFASNLYASSFRNAITAITDHGWLLLLPLSSSIVASCSVLLLYRWQLKRRQELIGISPAELRIGADALESALDDQDVIVGRSLRYLEVKRSSEDLVVFVHGLGLDANDFRPYMAESRFHCIAVTLYGFNTEEKDDPHYRPISLQSHVQLLSYALHKVAAMYPRKRITLVGFSFGADLLLFLSQFAAQETKDLAVRRAVLLDPNVNHSTTTISSRIAKIDESQQPTSSLAKILDSANSTGEFRNLCEYLYKITSKNFAQIRRHAKEVIAELDAISYDKFLDRLGQLSAEVGRANVVLSFDYEEHFNTIARGAAARGMDIQRLECSQLTHFELIGAAFLKDTLEGVLSPEADEP
jgi:pimeloyl-ACP methyl ester carboxylesterase